VRQRQSGEVETPIASLIDVVFLLIIFFVVTASIERDIVDTTIRLAQARDVPAVEKKDPNTITVNVRRNGAINIALQPLTLTQLQQILTATVQEYGNNVPILIRADQDTLYHEIDKVMNVIGKSGLYRVRLAAVATGK
jgi:biopolymer transport protein ExbD